MRKRMITAFVAMACIGCMTGCANKEDEVTTTEVTTVATEKTDNNTIKTTIYKPDDQAEELVSEEVEVKEVNENTLLEALKTNGVMNKDAKILSYELKNDTITIDFNKSVGTYFKKMGSAEESLKMQSMVKTLCENLKAKELKFTVEGEVLETGHQVYDLPIGVE